MEFGRTLEALEAALEKVEAAPAQGGSVTADSKVNNTTPIVPTRNFTLCEREFAALECLEERRHSRLELDRAIGSTNSPDTIMRLKRKGFPIERHWVPHVDRYGKEGRHGEYELLEAGRVMFAHYKQGASQ